MQLKHLPVTLLFLLAATIVQGQKQGRLFGYVKDLKTGETLVGATIQIEGTNIGTVTDTSGYYSIENIATQSYNVTASFIGFQSVTIYNVIVRSAGNHNLDFELEESSIQLGDVTVKVSPFLKKEVTPLSVQKLNRQEIVAYPGGNNDITRVIQSFPGVSGSIEGYRNDVIIRGGAPNEVVYYLDGIEIPNINHFATQGSGGGPVSLLNVSFFEGVNLTASAFSAQYDNALSGVLQFNQRKGNTRKQQYNIRVSATEAAFTTEGPLFKGKKQQANTSYLFSVRRSYLQFLFKLIDLPFLPSYWDYQLKVDHRIDKYNDISLIGLGNIDDLEINVPSDLTQEAQAQLDQLPIIEQWSNTAGISWRHRFRNGKGFMRTSLSYNILNNNFKRYQNNENLSGLYFSNNSKEWEAKLRYELTQYFSNWTLNSGISLQQVGYSNATRDFVNSYNFNSDLHFKKYGIFAQLSSPFLKGKLIPSLGFRMDGNNFTNSGNNLTKTFSPRAALSIKLDAAEQLSFNTSAGRYFKLPPSTILGFQNNNQVFVNQNAKYIRSDHLVAGFEWIPRPDTRITLEGFYKKYKHYPVSLRDSITLANLGASYEIWGSEDITSSGRGRAYGLEFFVQQKLRDNFYGILAYTWYKSEFASFLKSDYLPSTWDNQHLLSLTGGYKMKHNWEIGIKFRLLGRAPYPPVNLLKTEAVYPEIIYDYARLGEKRLDIFHAADIRIDKKWNFEQLSLNLYIDIQNLYGASTPTPPTYGLKRDDKGNILLPQQLIEIEDIEEGEIIPSIGLVLDF
ncbi:MAG: carboxypeptidase-like regulatory domain-containing protein [Marinifilaceae bacterium]